MCIMHCFKNAFTYFKQSYFINFNYVMDTGDWYCSCNHELDKCLNE